MATLLSEPDGAEVERTRAALYGLLSRFLAAPPDHALLQTTAALEGDATPVGRAVAELATKAAAQDVAAARDEYNALFIGLGRGELVPYASYYLTGFLFERPLAELRDELERLGIARAERNREPEDHIASLLEVMAGLIDGRFAQTSLQQQKAFFERHLDRWGLRFFADLEQAQSADLYRPVARLGLAFFEVERTAFTMVD